MLIDITEIVKNGEAREQAFFNWLIENNFFWYTPTNNLDLIELEDENNFHSIKQHWPEVKKI